MRDSCKPSKLEPGLSATYSISRSRSTCTIRSEAARRTVAKGSGGDELPTSRAIFLASGGVEAGLEVSVTEFSTPNATAGKTVLAPPATLAPINPRRLMPPRSAPNSTPASLGVLPETIPDSLLVICQLPNVKPADTRHHTIEKLDLANFAYLLSRVYLIQSSSFSRHFM